MCGKCTGRQAPRTGEKALAQHLLTRRSLAQRRTRRLDRSRHINTLQKKIPYPGIYARVGLLVAGERLQSLDRGGKDYQEGWCGRSRTRKETQASGGGLQLQKLSRTRDNDMKDQAERTRAFRHMQHRQGCARTSAGGASARNTADRASARTSAKGAHARNVADRASASTSARGAMQGIWRIEHLSPPTYKEHVQRLPCRGAVRGWGCRHGGAG